MWIPWLLPLLVSAAAAGYVDSGFMLVAPKVWRAGSEERLCITLFNLGSGVAEKSPLQRVHAVRNDAPRSARVREQISRRSLSDILGLLRHGRTTVPAARRQIATAVIPDIALRPEPIKVSITSTTVRVTIEFAYVRNGLMNNFKVEKQLPTDSGVQTTCFVVSVPDALKANFIVVTVHGNSTISKWSEIRVEPKVLVTLVQTDKAKYRPGQTVQLRVVSLRQDFTALDDTIKEIWITAPEGTRLAQWLNVKLTTGLVQKEFKLTEEPPLGRWTIHVKRADGAITRQPFTVEEFVPPRFELSVTAPGTIYSDSSVLTVNVCAKYTFGKPLVSADVRLEVSTSQPKVFQSVQQQSTQATANRNGQNKYSGKVSSSPLTNTTHPQTGNNGCMSIYVILSRISSSTGAISRNARQYLISVNVTEASTDISQTAEIVVPVRESKLFKVITTESPKFFKPGLEYYGTVRFERPDGSPVKREQIEICYTVTYRQTSGATTMASRYPPFIYHIARPTNRAEKCTVYRTDSSGRVIYVVPPQSGQVSSVSFKGRTLGTGQRFVLITVRAWYSPSDSFLLIDARPLLDGGACGQTVTISVLRSTNLRQTSLQYMVLSRGDVISDGVFSSGSVRLTLRSTMAPAFRLLVYGVTDQGEVVADSKQIRVAECLPNKVSVSWSRSQVKPGGIASLNVRASPGSLCGIDAVDRSAQLLGTSNTVSIQKVFSQVSRLVIREQALPRLTRTDSGYCPRTRRRSQSVNCSSRSSRGGIRTDGRYRIPYSQVVSSYKMDDRDDSIAAFDMAGFLAVTNLALQTRPCLEHTVTVTKYKTCYVQNPIFTGSTVSTSVFETRHVPRIGPRSSGVVSTGTSSSGQATRASREVGSAAASGGFTRSVDGGKTISTEVSGNSGRSAGRTTGTVLEAKVSAVDTSLGSVRAEAKESTVATSLGSGKTKADGGLNVDAETTTTENVETNPKSLEPIVRYFFPETFIFQLETLGSSGRIQLTQQLPDTITRWIGSAVCSHHKVGLGISPPSSIKVFKPFFAEINVPYSVKRGELLQLKVSVFNFLSSDLSVVLQLEDVPGVQLQAGSAGGARRSLCVAAARPAVSTFPVLFTSLGQVSLVVSVRAAGTACGVANSIGVQSDALLRKVLVKPEGFPQEETLSERICPKTGGSLTHVFELGYSPRVVPDSVRAVVSIYGDPLAQAITQLSGLESLVRVPHGCGEQNMVLLVPNILVRQYLEARKLLSKSLKKRTTDNMLSGYQRQLRYRHRDGSYSAFGESRWRRGRQGSLWLTVYVIRWFAAAQKYVPIDTADLAISRRWVERQQRGDGCFNRVGWLYQKAMSGGVAGGGRLALTAFTVLALLQTAADPAVVRRAVTCLRRGSPAGLYAQVLVTHALVMAGERAAAAKAIPALLRRAVRDKDSLHWRSERSSRWGGGSALDIEITAYMVLTLLRLDGHAGDARAAVRWLDRRRNGRGGWVSTQDTVVALSALVAAESRSSALTERGLEVSVRSGARFRRQFRVTADNRLLHQQAELRPLQLPTSVAVTVTGTGCVVAQTTMRYSLRETKANQAFKIKHTMRPVRKGACQTFILQICTSYIASDAASNMAIIEIEMLSGFLAVDYILQQLERSGVIRRWELRQSVLSLYFDQLVKTTICFDLRIRQETVVERLKPATIAVYDYYTTEQRVETDYALPDCK